MATPLPVERQWFNNDHRVVMIDHVRHTSADGEKGLYIAYIKKTKPMDETGQTWEVYAYYGYLFPAPTLLDRIRQIALIIAYTFAGTAGAVALGALVRILVIKLMEQSRMTPTTPPVVPPTPPPANPAPAPAPAPATPVPPSFSVPIPPWIWVPIVILLPIPFVEMPDWYDYFPDDDGDDPDNPAPPPAPSNPTNPTPPPEPPQPENPPEDVSNDLNGFISNGLGRDFDARFVATRCMANYPAITPSFKTITFA